MPSVSVRELEAGQIVGADVANIHRQVIVKAGSVVEARTITVLKAWGVSSVTIQGEAREAPVADAACATAPSAPQIPGDVASHPAIVELQAVSARLGQAVETGPTETTPPPASKGPTLAPISAQAITSRAATLASLPTIYFQVEKAINHPTASATDIAKVLRTDQALSARLLRIANSAFYGFPRRVESVDDAVRIIGTRQLHDLTLATVVLTQFKGVDPKLVGMKDFWRHSLACGLAAHSLTTFRRESNTERFFVAGLLHDLGSLVLYQQLPDRAQDALIRHHRSEITLEEAERSTIGCDHAEVGAALMARWRLPAFYQEAAARHHSNPAHSIGTAAIHIADLLVLALGLGTNGEARPPRFSPAAWDLLGLPPSCIGNVAEEVTGLLAETERLFLGDEPAP